MGIRVRDNESLDNALKKAYETNSAESSNENNNESTDDTDIPLVRNIDIDAIRKEATEIPNINEESDIARKLREIEREKMFNPDVIPVEQARNDSKGNFFNFLENEKVNMNMEEPILKTPTLNFELPKIQETKEDTTINNLSPNFGASKIETKMDKEIDEKVFDPVDLIDTLDPNFETKIEEKLGLDLKTAINMIRETKETLLHKGFNISLEETDLNDIYEFHIKIKKD